LPLIDENEPQVSLCGTQVWWTTEVGIAFTKLEEGYENAIKVSSTFNSSFFV
jgi:hypothetical protein